MTKTFDNRGFTLVEMLVSMTIFLLAFAAVLAAYTQGSYVAARIDTDVEITNNVRLAMDKMEREIRMIGFAVPAATQIGGSADWNPSIFHARDVELGFRADIDGGAAMVTCTPKTSNTTCPIGKLWLEDIDYYQALNCVSPLSGALKVVVTDPDGFWLPVNCTGVNTGDPSISVSNVTDNRFVAGESQAATVEQVYYRYTASSNPPFGVLERAVRYANAPNNAFAPGTTWTTVARNLIDFDLDYQDANGASLSPYPLSAANREAVRKVVLTMEGYDVVGGQQQQRRIRLRSEVFIRNAAL